MDADLTACELVCALLEAKLTQAQIAERAKVHQTTVSKLARGDSKDAMTSTYLALKKLHAEVCPNLANADPVAA